MGRVDDMARLYSQIQAGWQDRRRGNAELRSGVQRARTANRVANKERRERLSADLAAFMAVLAGHEKSRQVTAARSRKSRVEFRGNLARGVAATRQANRSENAAAAAAWRGGVVAKPSGRRGAAASSPSA